MKVWKAIAAVAALILAQVLAYSMVQSLPIPLFLQHVLEGVLYIVTAGMLLYLLYKGNLKQLRIQKGKNMLLWAGVAFALPAFVSGVLLLLEGTWQSSAQDTPATITNAIFVVGLGAGVVEEMVFRGALMKTIESKWGKPQAILIPSLLFGVLHATPDLGVGSMLLLLVAGTAVGIMFSLITYASDSVLCAAAVHAVWNMVMIGGIVNIGQTASEYSLFQYVLASDNMLLTGGDFGVEASMVSVVGYALVCGVCLYKLRKRA